MKIVVLRPLGLGDFLTGVPAYRAIADAFPAAHRILAAPAALAPLTALVDGIDQLVDTAPLAPLPGALHDADVAIDLHGRGPESQRVLLEAAPRRLIAFAHPAVPATIPGPAWRADEHEVERWCRMLTESGIPADPARIRLRTPPVIVPPHLRDATVIHPGAASEARRWPLERWVHVARAARQIGPVVVTGSRTERARTSALVHAAGIAPAYDVAGRTDLLELAALVAHAGRVICSDTGMAHLATAFGIPSVVLFGPTSPDDWGPRPNDGRHIVLWHGLRGDPHANTIDAGLLRIASDDVIAALHSLPGVSAIQPSA